MSGLGLGTQLSLPQCSGGAGEHSSQGLGDVQLQIYSEVMEWQLLWLGWYHIHT